jgi:SAM-dependent methyltransferase
VGEPPVYDDAEPGVLARAADPVARRARRKRFLAYHAALAPEAEDRILDIGCGPSGLAGFEPAADVTGLDADEQPDYPGRRFVRGDARELPFDTHAFDIAYSNSLVEHLAPEDRPAFAREVRRVARRYWIQTPNRHFPVEPHVLLPAYHWLPQSAQRRLWRFGRLEGDYEPISLLDEAELRALFPDATILRERFAGLTKSLIAVGPAGSLARG